MRGFFSLSLNEQATKRKEAKESREEFILKYQIYVFGKGFSPVHLQAIHIDAKNGLND